MENVSKEQKLFSVFFNTVLLNFTPFFDILFSVR